MRRGIAVLILLAGHVASADDVDDLVAKGQELAKQSEFTQAIVAFKQADAKRPRAAHACMIGLAYMRREAWPQAELFLALCKKRATPGDEPPDWMAEAEQQLAAKLSAAQIPAVTIDVTPANVGARLTVSSFAPDEQFEPQTIHLAPGKHVIEVTAPGYDTASQDVTITADKPERVTITLWKTGTHHPLPPPVAPRAPRAPRSKVPMIVTSVGVGIVALSLVYDVTAVRNAHDRLAGAETGPAYDVYAPDWRDRRSKFITMFAIGAIVTGVGVTLRYTVFREGPQVTAQVLDHGGGIVVGWQR